MRRWAAVILEWLLVAAASMLVMAMVYPDMLVFHDIRFTAGHDLEIPYQSAWVLAGYFLRGGMQLWSRMDQVNHAYYALTTGFQGLTPIVEGWVFSLFAHGLSRPGEAFQAFHPLFFFSLTTLFRTAGGLALLSLYPVPRWARILTLLVANTLLAAQTYNGVMTGFLYSLTPLVLYFLLRFFRRFRVTAALWAILALGLAFAQIPLFALGYFYMPIHFFLVVSVAAFGWWGLQARRIGPATGSPATSASTLHERVALAAGFAALAVVVAMNVDYLHLFKTTFYVASSGLSGTSGRLNSLFNPLAFITKGIHGPDIGLLPFYALDFTKNRWWFSWQWIGAASLGLALIGLTHGRHRERWLYGAAFLLTVLAMQPAILWSLGLPAHLITGLTNPFGFLIANPHMSSLLMPYFLVVPIGLGLHALWCRAQAGAAPGKTAADAGATALLLTGAFFALVALPFAAALESAAVFLALALCLLAPRLAVLRRGSRLPMLALAVPLAAVAADLWGYSVYLKHVPYTGDHIRPRSFKGIEASDGRKINPVVFDYQNPATLTFPRHVRVAPDPVAPTTDPAFPTNFAVYFIRQTYMGAYFNTVFLSRYFNPPALYELRPLRYRDASDKVTGKDTRTREQKALYPLLKADNRALFFAPVGVAADKIGPAELVAADAGRWAVALRNPAGGRVPDARDALPNGPPNLPPQREEQRSYALTLGDAVARRQRNGFVAYDFPLPKGFPAYMATNLFTADRDSIRLWLDGKELAPAQGHLIRPFTFDVRNVATDRLVVALPADQPAASRLRLSVTIDGFLKDVRPNRNDTVGLTVEAPADGWLVWRSPYEDGWQASLDGRSAPIYIADITAMAVRVPAGRSKVTFAYKPAGNCCTRRLVEAQLFASPLLALVILAAALYGAAVGGGGVPAHDQPKRQNEDRQSDKRT